MALPTGGTIAVKAVDGGDRAVGPALVALLVRHLGLDDIPSGAESTARPAVLNDAGAVVGELKAMLPNGMEGQEGGL